jgi:hypothetical protein
MHVEIHRSITENDAAQYIKQTKKNTIKLRLFCLRVNGSYRDSVRWRELAEARRMTLLSSLYVKFEIPRSPRATQKL